MSPFIQVFIILKRLQIQRKCTSALVHVVGFLQFPPTSLKTWGQVNWKYRNWPAYVCMCVCICLLHEENRSSLKKAHRSTGRICKPTHNGPGLLHLSLRQQSSPSCYRKKELPNRTSVNVFLSLWPHDPSKRHHLTSLFSCHEVPGSVSVLHIWLNGQQLMPRQQWWG